MIKFPDWAGFTPEFAKSELKRLIPVSEANFRAVEASSPKTFADLVHPLNDASRDLWRVWGMVLHELSVCNAPEWRQLQDEFQPTLVALSLKIAQSKAVYKLAKKVKCQNALEKRIASKMVQGAELAGVALEGAKQRQFNRIQTRLAKLGSDFTNEVIDTTDDEIAEHLGFSERTVTGLRLADLRTFSLHDPIQQGEEGEFQDIIPDRGAMTPDRILGDEESVHRLLSLLSELDERERLILKLRFGLDGKRPKTLEEVSQEIRRTRERVRQIQNQALAKLRAMLADEAGFTNE